MALNSLQPSAIIAHEMTIKAQKSMEMDSGQRVMDYGQGNEILMLCLASYKESLLGV